MMLERAQESSSIGSRLKATAGHHILQLSPLTTVEPEGLNAVNAQDGWEQVLFAVDSGASETVIPPDALGSINITPGDASKRGVMYEVANGDRIPNLGEKVFTGCTNAEGIARQIRAQVCEVSKPLLSVAKLVRAGNTGVRTGGGLHLRPGWGGLHVARGEERHVCARYVG